MRFVFPTPGGHFLGSDECPVLELKVSRFSEERREAEIDHMVVE